MPYFAYKGRDGSGKLVQGVLEGADSGVVAGLLINTNVTPVEITPSAPPRVGGAGFLRTLSEPKIGHADVLLFTRQL